MPATQDSQVLVLTAPDTTPCLNTTLTDTITRILAKDAIVGKRWLSHGEAWELEFITQADAGTNLRQQAATALIGHPVDINIIPGGDARRKKLLVADMDSTIIEQECIDEIAELAGIGAQVATVTERAMRGELDFTEALKSRVALLEGLPAGRLEDVLNNRISVMPGATTLVGTMKRNGAHTALVSGGFTYFTQAITDRVGFDTNQANELVIADQLLAGTVKEPILGREAKLEALQQHAARLGLSLSETLAVGDGANDLAMVTAAGLGVAYRAKPVVAKEAMAAINHGDLTALLYLQGYTRDEFAD